jgi:hypothetical protein
MYDSGCFGQLVCNTLKKGGWGLHALCFVIFVIPTFFIKQNMSSILIEEETIEHAIDWDN